MLPATFVLSPLAKLAPTNASLERALARYETANGTTRSAWDAAYLTAVAHVQFRSGVAFVPRAMDGPVPTLISSELTMARSGALDADLLAQRPFYGTDYTKPLLFVEDGNYFAAQARPASDGCPVGGDERDR